MKIRAYQPKDCKILTELFYSTVHSVNAKDYTKKQLDAWASGQADLEQWNRSLTEHYSLVALDRDTIIAFGDIDNTGYLDRLFVHADYQKQGAASALCDLLEKSVPGDITTHTSITAKPFFEKRGYTVIKKQQVERKGILLTNFIMKKKK